MAPASRSLGVGKRMKKLNALCVTAILICVVATGFAVHQFAENKRRADVEFTRDACMQETRVAKGMLFDMAEAEFHGLQSIEASAMNEKTKSMVRERMVFCVMVMQHCAAERVVVTREAPADGFEDHTVTDQWIKAYVETVSRYPEWSKRRELIMGVLVKTSG